MRRIIAFSAALALLGLTGCSFAPEYQRPALPESPDAYKETGGWARAHPADTLARGAWWTLFGDARLNELEDKVTASNQDIKAAVARFDEARAAAGAARADYFPTVTGTAGLSRQQVSGNIISSTHGKLYNDLQLAADFSYEIDVWGRVRNSVAAAENRSSASEADLAAMDLATHAELAIDYFALRGDDAQSAVLAQTVAAYQKALELTQNRYKGGIAAAADVDQAETQYENAKTQAAETSLKRAQLEHVIAVLTGVPPTGFALAPAPLDNAPPPAIDAGLPSTLLERRPDIASAERLAMAANADIGVARAAYFPRLSLAGLLGFEGSRPASFLTAPSREWMLGPSVTQTLFDAGRIGSLTEEAKAAYAETAAYYRQTVLAAYQDVEDTLAALRQLAQEAQTQTAAAAAAGGALAQARYRYAGGLTTYLDMVVAENTALQAELALADIRARRMTASVQLIKALGGGWSAPENKESPAGNKPENAE